MSEKEQKIAEFEKAAADLRDIVGGMSPTNTWYEPLNSELTFIESLLATAKAVN